MKKIFVILFTTTILLVPVFGSAAQNQQGIDKTGVDIENSGKREETDQSQQKIHKPDTDIKKLESEKKTDQDKAETSQGANKKAISRRSRVANAIQEMERIATNNQGIGDQVRVIAQNQNRTQEEAEGALQTVQKRGGFAKFFIGPNYKQLKIVENRLENNLQNLTKLKELRTQIKNSPDGASLDEQIQTMEEITGELREETVKEKKGFSLFGWLFKLRSK